MKLITNIESPFLSDILLKTVENLKEIKAAIAYCCENYEIFEYCKKNKIKLDYYGRLDPTINLDLTKLKSFLTDNISVYIVGGNSFHPKVIWCVGYGAYIGSANLTQSAWEKNIECGLWLDQKELDANGLTDSLNNFFKFIEEKVEATHLSDISSEQIQKLNKTRQNLFKSNVNSLSKFEELGIPIFRGLPKNKKDKNWQSNQQNLNEGCMSKCYLESKEWPCFLNDQNCKRNKKWTCIHELKCLLVFKQFEAGELLNPLCEDLAEDKVFSVIGSTKEDIKKSRISSIKQKIYNIHFVSGKNIKRLGNRSNNSETTEKIFEICKDWSIDRLDQKIKKLEGKVAQT